MSLSTFHKIHELACMVDGVSEKIPYVLYDMYKGNVVIDNKSIIVPILVCY